jgi:hypothetical protein
LAGARGNDAVPQGETAISTNADNLSAPSLSGYLAIVDSYLAQSGQLLISRGSHLEFSTAHLFFQLLLCLLPPDQQFASVSFDSNAHHSVIFVEAKCSKAWTLSQ